jgi:Flp pilus assembly protein TadD
MCWGCAGQEANEHTTLAVNELAAREVNRKQSLVLYRQGVAAYEAADVEKAQKLLSDAVSADSRNAYAWMALGVVEYQRDRMFEAAWAFYRAARLEPQRYEPLFNMGTVLESAGRYEKAIEAYEDALKAAPDQVEVMESLARCCVRSNSHLDRVKELMKKALQSEQRPEWRRWLEGQVTKLENADRGKHDE